MVCSYLDFNSSCIWKASCSDWEIYQSLQVNCLFQVPLISNDGKKGLGTFGAVSAPPLVPKPRPKNTIAAATLRLASRTKMLQPPAKAFQGDEDESLE